MNNFDTVGLFKSQVIITCSLELKYTVIYDVKLGKYFVGLSPTIW